MEPKELMIGGVTVKFPCKPYPSQLSMMSRIIKGLQNGNHCLLESPTGSGKTLALLCSALAWQNDIRKKVEAENAYADQCVNERRIDCSADSAKDFECCEKDKNANSKAPKDAAEPKKRKRVPVIWFGTRTHKQIAQVAHELSRTEYKNTPMTILSSREYSCIHPINEKSKNKNDGCRDLLRGKHSELLGAHCSFYTNVHRLKTHTNLYSCGLTSAWDLEDLVRLGRRINACPYYGSRELMVGAAIIFCPYNYLVDPGIRSHMKINLKEQVVILDEAHNIEDCCRDAASNTLVESDLINTIADLDHLIADGVNVEQHKPLHLLCTKIGQWLQRRSLTLSETSYETWSQVWKGPEFLSCLNEWGITSDTLPMIQKCFLEAVAVDDNEDKELAMALHSASQALLGGLFHVLSYLLYDDKKYAQDFRIAIIRHAEYGVPPPKRTRDGWISISKRSSKYYSVGLHFWCLNPAVAFGAMTNAHCIVLTSGTLSPMLSFSSELGASFPIQLEAPHVIADKQVWVGSIGCGPSGQQLQATYQNTNALSFQDDLGKLILAICDVVPHGVLCFFSSYKMLEKMCERWENTGLWLEMSQVKALFCEPHGKNKSNFEEVMQSFYEFTSSDAQSGSNGALLLAVCRGKISEGIDFSDNNARAVITVGIPFPNFKDQQVELKRKYNDEHSKSRGLLAGGDWYEIQAFRALNQALGRCIRHRNDWGALVIVDDRFCKNPKRYCKGLSKWVRSKIKTYHTFQSASDSLAAFCHARELGSSPEKLACDDGDHYVSSSILNSSDCAPDFVVQNSTARFFTPQANSSNACSSSGNFWENAKSSKLKTQSFKSDPGNAGDSSISVRGEIKASSEQKAASGNKSCTVSNCEDVVMIPSTPKKREQVIVIPESPEDFDYSGDKGNVSKRKGACVQSPNTLSHRLAKKCKQNLFVDEKQELQDAVNKPDLFVDSQELYAPRTRRKRSLKTSRMVDHKPACITKNYDCSKRDQKDERHVLLCASCKEFIFETTEKAVKVCDVFDYIEAAFFDVEAVYKIPSLPKENFLSKITSRNNNIILDCVWCPKDQLAYQLYACSNCQLTIAFHVVNSTKHKDFFLLQAKFVEKH